MPMIDAAVDLALMHERIEHRAGAVRGGELFEFHLAGFRIDLDFGNLNAQRRFRTGLEILVKALAANCSTIHARDVAIADTGARSGCRPRRRR